MEDRFNAALANKLKNQDSNAAANTSNAEASMMNAQTTRGLMPSEIEQRQAYGNALTSRAGTERAQMASANPMGFSSNQVDSMGLRGFGFNPSAVANQNQGALYGTGSAPGVSTSAYANYLGQYGDALSGGKAPPPAPGAAPSLTAPKPAPNPYGEFARGGMIGDRHDPSHADNRLVLAHPREYMLNEKAVTHGFGDGDYDTGLRNLNEIVRQSTGQEPGATYSKKAPAGYARSGSVPARTRAPLVEEEGTDPELITGQFIPRAGGAVPSRYPMPYYNPNQPNYQDGRDAVLARQAAGQTTPVAVPVTPPSLRGMSTGGWNRMVDATPVSKTGYPMLANSGEVPPKRRKTKYPMPMDSGTIGVASPEFASQARGLIKQQNPTVGAITMATPEYAENARAQVAAQPSRTSPQSAALERQALMYERLGSIPGMGGMAKTIGDIRTQWDRGQGAEAVGTGLRGIWDAAEGAREQTAKGISAGTLGLTDVLGGVANGATGNVQPPPNAATPVRPGAPAAPAAGVNWLDKMKDAAAPQPQNNWLDKMKDYAPNPVIREAGTAGSPAGAGDWAIRDAIQKGGQAGQQIQFDYGAGHGGGPNAAPIVATADKNGRFNSFSNMGLRMARGGQIPEFANSGQMGFEGPGFEMPPPDDLMYDAHVQERVRAENLRNAQEAWRATRQKAPVMGEIPTGVQGDAGPLDEGLRKVLQGRNTTTVGEAAKGVANTVASAAKAVGPTALKIAKVGGETALIDAGWQGVKGAWTTQPRDYSKRLGVEPGDDSIGGHVKDIAVRGVGALSDVGAGLINAAALPYNLMQHGTDTKKWWDWGEQNFKDKQEERRFQDLMDRRETLKLKAAKDAAGDQATAQAGDQQTKETAPAYKPNMRDLMALRAMALGGGGTGAMTEQGHLLNYLASTDPNRGGAGAANSAVKMQEEHEKAIDDSLLPRFNKVGPDGKTMVPDLAAYERFKSDMVAHGKPIYNQSRSGRDALLAEWGERDATMQAAKGEQAKSGDTAQLVSDHTRPMQLKQGLDWGDYWGSPNIGIDDYAKSFFGGKGLRNQVVQIPVKDPRTGATVMQSFAARDLLANSDGTVNLDRLAHVRPPEK